ncbi:hypothetical protein IJG93_01335 [Candidatus Saccharibacteria bacterium]|nr:hypothetical protein [Candidatus Saccharibacteria bacterium]
MPSDRQIDSIGGEEPGSSIYVSSFSPVVGGFYYNGGLNREAIRGFWWGSNPNVAERCLLRYDSNNLNTGSNPNFYGIYLRCVQAS